MPPSANVAIALPDRAEIAAGLEICSKCNGPEVLHAQRDEYLQSQEENEV